MDADHDHPPGGSDASEQQERLLNLVSMLYKARRPVPGHRILATLEGYDDNPHAARLFEHDKARLATLGVIVRHVDDGLGDPGYVVDSAASLLPPIDLTAEERLILETLVRSYADRGGEFAASLQSALLKLSFDNFQPGEREHAEADADAEPDGDAVSDAPAPGTPLVGSPGGAEDRSLDVLMDAVLNRKTIRFRYQRPDGQAAEMRRVDPWGIAFVRGAWYLAGFSHERQQERMFRLSRIVGRPARERDNAQPDFEPPQHFALDAMVTRLMAPRDEAQRYEDVRLQIGAAVAFMLEEWVSNSPDKASGAGGLAVFARAADGAGGELLLRAPVERNVWRVIADYAPHAVVTYPPDLQAAFRERLQRLRDRYQD
ncbi:MAG: helix-turn-helix transcriptional regulator [Planctomycetota bacterium]